MPGADLVTGEAVRLDVRAASFATRMLAAAVDAVVTGLLAIAASWAFFALASTADEAAGAAAALVLVVAALVGLPTTVESLTRGRSLGKLVMGLRVVRDDGGPVRFRQALIRALVGFAEIYLLLGSPAVIASLSNDRGKRVGDFLAGTYVVRERRAPLVAPAVLMPPELAAWARAADIGSIPDRHAMALRQFLARADRLHPSSRQRLAVALTQDTVSLVLPLPPAGTHPERFLAAVVAERSRRELARMQREQRTREHDEAVLHRLPYGLG